MESRSQKMIVKEFDLLRLAEQSLGEEMFPPCDCINQLNNEEDKGSLNSERQILPKEKVSINLQWISGIWR